MTGRLAAAVDRIVSTAEIGADLESARSAIDELLWRRDVRAAAAEYSAGSRLLGSRDSAGIDGADVVVVDDSPMGRVLASAQAITAEVPDQVATWGTAPLQVLARLHMVAAHGHVAADGLGRPRRDEETSDDPLSLALQVPAAPEAAGRLALLADLVTTAQEAPALAVAGIVHAELLTARPFAWGSGLLGRACIRLVLADRGVDPSLFSVPEAGIVDTGRPAYVRALRDYAAGRLPEYFGWFAGVIRLGAQAAAPAST